MSFLYVNAALSVCCIARDSSPLNSFEIRQIHTLVLGDRPDDKGRFRRVPVRAAGARAVPAEPHLIGEKLAELPDADKARLRDYLRIIGAEQDRLMPS